MNQDAVRLGQAPLNRDGAARPGVAPADLERAEAGLSALLEAWQRAIEELGAMVPPAQVRALLIIEATDDLNVTGLARLLGASPSATSRLCDRLAAAGLLAPRRAAWVREQRRKALIQVLEQITPDGRADLARGLSEVPLP